MAIQLINLGSQAQDGRDGDNARIGFTKVNSNFNELQNRANEQAYNHGLLVDLVDDKEFILVQGEGININRSSPTAPIISLNKLGIVYGPSSSIDGTIPLFDGTTGVKLKQGVNVNAFATSLQGEKADTAIQAADLLAQNFEKKLTQGRNIVISRTDANAPVIGTSERVVTGPATTTVGNIALFDNTTGNTLREGVALSSLATSSQGQKADTALQPNILTSLEKKLVEGSNITIDRTDPDNPVISSGNTTLSDADIKAMYERNADTNAFTDNDVVKLNGIAVQATKNETDAQLRDRSTHTGTQLSSTISDLANAVRSTILTGLPAGSTSDITESNTVLEALANLQLQIKSTGAPLFSVMWWPKRATIPDGYLPADGQLIDRIQYPLVAQGVVSAQVSVSTEELWQSDISYRGRYTAGDGTTTIRLPDYNGKSVGTTALFLRGDGTNALSEGRIQADELKSHTHGAGRVQNAGDGTARWTPRGIGSEADYNVGSVGGNETRPVNVAGVWCIKVTGQIYYTPATTQSIEQMGVLVSQLVDKVDQVGITKRHAWQNVSSSRAIGTTYTNTTPYPIHVAVRLSGLAAAAFNASLVVNGLAIEQLRTSAAGSISESSLSSIVPPNATYSLYVPTGTISLTSWAEFRYV